jgi:enediyne biosynthesis protein E4
MGRTACALLIAILFLRCNSDGSERLFSIIHGNDAGIDFQNTIISNDSTNALTFEYIYNGSGVGIGDFNNDGFEDVFFGGNDVSSELYLNKGNFKFEKITHASGLATNKWITGVSVVDINQDGWKDIYLCVGGKTTPDERRNMLFINKGLRDGVPYFEEEAKQYALDDPSYSTMAAFFDYDKDGDSDMYLVNNWLEQFNRNNLRPKRYNGEAESTDKLFRNNGDGTFTNVSREAGILIEGYGLGINITDINQDTWPDIYVSNDFLSNDLLWINNGDGTFINRIGEFLKHQTHNGMGVDIADFNNDALSDIVVVDMLPPGHRRQKLMTPGQNHDHFHLSLTMDYQPQYMRNTLQLNQGENEKGVVMFSEIAFMSGVAQTDWSWAPLFADFDNDGWKDLFVANGYRKDVTNLDFIFFGFKNVTPFGTSQTRKTITDNEFRKIEDVKLSNCFFRNTGTLTFEDMTGKWCEEMPTFSNGTAYADLDNDGDLDLITNNIDQEVILYQNNLSSENGYVNFKSLESFPQNEKIWLYSDGKVQYQEVTPYRGFQSTVSSITHFGIGLKPKADSIVIEWPDGKEARYYDIPSRSVFEYRKKDAISSRQLTKKGSPFEFHRDDKMVWTHQEKSPSDIKVTRTLMHELGRYGPCYAKGDVNGDGLDDFYFGTEVGDQPKLFIQQKDGSFEASLLSTNSTREDGAALFFDSDSDGDLDLYVAGACPSGFVDAANHILYINDGRGAFHPAEGVLPDIRVSSLTVQAEDYDRDGDLDLFVGGHLKPNQYPLSDRSFLLRNSGGKFTDVTQQVCAALMKPGLVTSSCWADLNQDDKPDLTIAGEWMPIRVFLNEGQKFREATREFDLESSNGWWNVVKAVDVNGDHFPELIAGNTGSNSYFKPTVENPLILMADDFDKNGSTDPILTYFNPIEKERYIVHNRLVLIDQIPAIKRRIQTFTQYATAPMEKIFTGDERARAVQLRANILTSVLLRNEKGKRFTTHALPEAAQMSMINDVLVDDVNTDGREDLILTGNNYDQETLFGRYDASVGTVLLNDGKGGWINAPHSATKFTAGGDIRHATSYNSLLGKRYMLLLNNDSVATFRVSGKGSAIAVDPRVAATSN